MFGGIVADLLCVVTPDPVMVTVYVPLLSIENFTEPVVLLQLSDTVFMAIWVEPE